MTKGQKLRGLRGSLSRSEVCKEVGISERTLTFLEKDQRDCKSENLFKLADYYGVKVDDLRSDKE